MEQSFTAVQLLPETENCALLLMIESRVSDVGRGLYTSSRRVIAVLGTPFTAVPITSCVAESTGHWRVVRVMGVSGVWLKLKLSVVSLALASRVERNGRPKRSSMNFSTEENSYCVVEMYPFFAYGDTI